VIAKCFRRAAPVLPGARADALRRLVDRVDAARDLTQLGALLRRPTGRSRSKP
jgi:hypothetical protein